MFGIGVFPASCGGVIVFRLGLVMTAAISAYPVMTFASAKKDFFDEFQDNISLKLHIEYLVNNYFKDCKEYFLNQDKYAVA